MCGQSADSSLVLSTIRCLSALAGKTYTRLFRAPSTKTLKFKELPVWQSPCTSNPFNFFLDSLARLGRLAVAAAAGGGRATAECRWRELLRWEPHPGGEA
jgi:hypothetical protein